MSSAAAGHLHQTELSSPGATQGGLHKSLGDGTVQLRIALSCPKHIHQHFLVDRFAKIIWEQILDVSEHARPGDLVEQTQAEANERAGTYIGMPCVSWLSGNNNATVTTAKARRTSWLALPCSPGRHLQSRCRKLLRSSCPQQWQRSAMQLLLLHFQRILSRNSRIREASLHRGNLADADVPQTLAPRRRCRRLADRFAFAAPDTKGNLCCHCRPLPQQDVPADVSSSCPWPPAAERPRISSPWHHRRYPSQV